MMSRSGQSLVEVLVATAVGTILLVGTLTIIVPALRGNTQAQHAQTASALARELLDRVRAWGEGGWTRVYDLSKGSSNRYFLIPTASPFTIATGTESFAVDGLSGLIGHWKLDETSVATAYNFATSTGNGTSDNSPSATSTCRVGDCWYFNGSTQRIVVSGNPSLFQISTGTLSAWIKTANAGNSYRSILTKQNAYGMLLQDNVFGVYDWGAGAWRTSGVSLNDDLWHHVACSFQSGVANGTLCYIDGVLRLTTTITVNSQTTNLMIAEGNSSQHFAGRIDDARIYSRALSAAEIARLYNAPIYLRHFYVENASRSSGAIVTSGGSNDPSTQKVTVAYAWPQTATRTISTYLTRNRTNLVWQTDWSGGSGQDGPTTTVNSLFATSSNVSVTTTTGSIRILGL